jgi:hypothetical protein
MTTGYHMLRLGRRKVHGSAVRGQALTEFLMVALALVPLFLLVPFIAKYQDIAHATQVAARYVAFEAAVRNNAMNSFKPEQQLAEEVQRRFFSNIDAPVRTNDRAGNIRAHQNPFWRDPEDNALIRDFQSDVTVGFGTTNGTGHMDAFSNTADGTAFPLHQQMGLRAQGMYTANVSVALANLPALQAGTGMPDSYAALESIDLSITRSTTLLTDSWTSAGPAQTENRSGGNPRVFPASALKNVSPIVDAFISVVDAPGNVTGPKLGRLDFWRDVVPADRLQSGN